MLPWNVIIYKTSCERVRVACETGIQAREIEKACRAFDDVEFCEILHTSILNAVESALTPIAFSEFAILSHHN